MLVFSSVLVKTVPESMRPQKLEEYEIKRIKQIVDLNA